MKLLPTTIPSIYSKKKYSLSKIHLIFLFFNFRDTKPSIFPTETIDTDKNCAILKR